MALRGGADLRAANLNGARLRGSDLTGASLARANLRGADLEGAVVTGADFSGTDFCGASLRGVRGFEKATWIEADVRDVNFCGAYMLRRFITDQNYLHEFRRRGRLSQVTYMIWWLTSDCGRSLTRWALLTMLLVAVFANLYELVSIDYGQHKTPWSPLYYSFVTFTTLGYGDVVPASSAAQVLAVIEVMMGYLALGGLLGIFANKMGRRAE